MNIILLESGEPPRLERVPGDDPVAGLADLLGGGELEVRPLTDSLTLFTRKDAENLLPIRYRVDTRRLAFPIYGNCAVARHKAGGRLCSIQPDPDMDTVHAMISPLGDWEVPRP